MARPIKRPDHHYKPFEFTIDIEDAFDYLDKFKNSPDYPKSFSYYTPNKYKILGDILENKFGINTVEARKIAGMWFDKNREKKIVKLTESDLTRIVKKVINEGKKKYDYLDEHPSYGDLNSKITELKKMINTISKEIMGDEPKEYVQEYVDKKLFNK